MRKLAISFFLICFIFLFIAQVNAQEKIGIVEYGDKPIVDSDLDGLTDAGELQKFFTDPDAIDSDGDSVIDGAEVQFHSDPNNASSIPSNAKSSEEFIAQEPTRETPWAWYASRASALIGFGLLYISVIFGLTIRMPFIQKMLPGGAAMRVHCWISFQSLIFAFLHGISLMFDKFFKFEFIEIFVPFFSNYKRNFVALGTISFYLMILLVFTSYARRFMSQRLWRILHFANIFLYVGSVVHAFAIGTDLKNQNIRYIFIFANVFLLIILVEHIASRVIAAIRIRRMRIKGTNLNKN